MTSARKKIASKAEAIGLVLRRGDTDDAGYALFAAKDIDVENDDEDEDVDGEAVRLVEERHERQAAAAEAAAKKELETEEVVFGHGFTASLEEIEAFLDNRAALVGINVKVKDRASVAPPSPAKLEKALDGRQHADEIKRLIGKSKRGRPKKDDEKAEPPEKPAERQDDDGFDDEPITFPGSRNPPPLECYDPAPKATGMPVVVKKATASLRLDTGGAAIRSALDKLNLAKEIGDLYRRGRPVDLIEAGRLLKRKQDQANHGESIQWLTKNETALGFGRMTAHRLIKRAMKYSSAA
jgi:hypothetical protein